jgi:hypothetical protein
MDLPAPGSYQASPMQEEALIVKIARQPSQLQEINDYLDMKLSADHKDKAVAEKYEQIKQNLLSSYKKFGSSEDTNKSGDDIEEVIDTAFEVGLLEVAFHRKKVPDYVDAIMQESATNIAVQDLTKAIKEKKPREILAMIKRLDTVIEKFHDNKGFPAFLKSSVAQETKKLARQKAQEPAKAKEMRMALTR